MSSSKSLTSLWQDSGEKTRKFNLWPDKECLEMEDFIDISECSREKIEEIYSLTASIKDEPGKFQDSLENKTLLMLFAKPSTRTRTSFEAGMTEMGGHAVFLPEESSQLSRGETLGDTARTLSRYSDAIMARLFDHQKIEGLAEYSGDPVINGLTDWLHPCQALSDFYTLREKGIEGDIAYVGDGNNVANSLAQAAEKLNHNLRIATPSQHRPDMELIEKGGGCVEIFEDPGKAVKGAKAVYTDSWRSMGEEGKKISVFKSYQVNSELMSHAADDAVFMHCLPAHRGQEVTDKVIDSDRSIVFDQAENRMHTQKALLHELID